MRYSASCAIGFIAAAVIYNILAWAFGTIGVRAHDFLSLPAEHFLGRYSTAETEKDTTIAGHAFFLFAAVAAANVGAAVYRKTFRPWMTTSEKATSKAWWFVSTFLVFCMPVFQLLSHSLSSGIPGSIVSALEFAVPAYVVWKTWSWWKAASVAVN